MDLWRLNSVKSAIFLWRESYYINIMESITDQCFGRTKALDSIWLFRIHFIYFVCLMYIYWYIYISIHLYLIYIYIYIFFHLLMQYEKNIYIYIYSFLLYLIYIFIYTIPGPPKVCHMVVWVPWEAKPQNGLKPHPDWIAPMDT